MSKQARPHSPVGTRLEGPDPEGNFRIIIPSESERGVEHTLVVDYTGEAQSCTCRGYRRYQEYVLSLFTTSPQPARRLCWHFEAAADLLAHHLDPPPADRGGAALDRAQVEVDGEIDDWLPAALRDHMRRRFDEAVAADGHRWIQSRTEAGVRLTCVSCHAVRGWASEGMAAAWLEGGGTCGCGGRPIPPAQGAARKPLDECLQDLYGA